jgi:glycine/D-amino acid oxidase-like deaminating enzyme
LHLARSGTDAALLEAVEIGFGAAGRNVGLVNAGMWVMPDDLPRVLGAVHGERLLDVLGNAPKLVFDLIETHGINYEVVRAGTLHCAVGPKGLTELVQRAAQWTARGAPVRLLEADETAAKVGTSAYSGSFLDRVACASRRSNFRRLQPHPDARGGRFARRRRHGRNGGLRDPARRLPGQFS